MRVRYALGVKGIKHKLNFLGNDDVEVAPPLLSSVLKLDTETTCDPIASPCDPLDGVTHPLRLFEPCT